MIGEPWTVIANHSKLRRAGGAEPKAKAPPPLLSENLPFPGAPLGAFGSVVGSATGKAGVPGTGVEAWCHLCGVRRKGSGRMPKNLR